MDIIQKNGNIILQNVSDFNTKHIFECGQCFRWDIEEDNSFTGVVDGKVINVLSNDNDVIIKNSNINDVENFWIEYFDLNRDYSKIKNELSLIDENMKNAVEFGNGIRILNQPFGEIVISFIISARNAIPSIKRSIKLLSESLGEYITTYNGKDYHSFPTLETLSNSDLEKIIESKVAFRAKYIQQTSKYIIENNIKKDDFENKSLDEINEILIKFAGVGPKVADCISLFSLQKYDSFPVDVWVNRVMGELYFKNQKLSLKKLRTLSKEIFGEKAGFAQQYLFYYARENGIGK